MSTPKKMPPASQLTPQLPLPPANTVLTVKVPGTQRKKHPDDLEDIFAKHSTTELTGQEALSANEALPSTEQIAAPNAFGPLAAAPGSTITDAGSTSPLQLSQLNIPASSATAVTTSTLSTAPSLNMSTIFGGMALMGLAAGGGGGKSSAGINTQPTAPGTTEIGGTLINGYIANATVFQDNDRDGIHDADEPFTTTDEAGKFTLDVSPDGGPLVAVGDADTVDQSTGAAVTSTFKAPLGATVISPLSTLVAAGLTENQIKTAFGIDPGIDLLDFNPISSALLADDPTLALQYKAASVMVSNLMDVGNSLIGGATNKITDTSAWVINGIVKLITDQTGPIDLRDTNTVKSVLTESLRQASGSADNAVLNTISNKVASANSAIVQAAQAASTSGDARTALETIAKIELVTQTTLANGVHAATKGSTTGLTNFDLAQAVDSAVVPEIAAIFKGLSFDEVVAPIATGQSGGSTALVTQPDGNDILKFEKSAGSAGLYAHLTLSTSGASGTQKVDPIALSPGDAKLGMWVHTAQAGTKVRLQIGDSAAGGYPNDNHWVEVEVSTTKAGWEYLTFDFENPTSRFIANGAADGSRGYTAVTELSTGVTYDMVAVFFDLGVRKLSAETYYLDKLTPLSLKSDVPPAAIDFATVDPIPEGYQLVLNDEFDSGTTPTAPDNSVWKLETGRGPNGDGWGNGESQVYESGLDDAYLQNGNLHIIAKRTGDTITSARLKSQLGDTLDPYGYVEVKAKLPAETGAWPAIWMLGQGTWPNTGEIDIVEWSAKYFQDQQVQGALHFYGDNNVTKRTYGDTEYKASTTLSDTVENFHTYQLWWTPEFIRIGVDGNINTAYFEYTKPANATADNWPFSNPMDIILNLAIGGTLGGNLPNGNFQYEMVVDYVRVYQSGIPSQGNFTTLDFSGTGYQFNAFEGTAASIVTDPSSQGSSNKVLRYVESATAKSYAGVSIGLDSAFSVDPIAFDAAAGETAITARIWVDPQYGTGQVVRMQVADTAGSNDAHYVEAQATITQSGWNTLVFDFSQPVSRYVAAWGTAATVSLASNAVYDKISMFVDWDNGYAWNDAPVGTPPSTERTYYIDDVTFVGQVPPPTATFSTLDFSGTGYQFNAFEGTAASIVTDPSSQGSSNKVLRYVESATAKSYAGVSIGLDSAFSVDPIAFDAAAGETAITARIWVDPQYGTGQVVRMQVADTAGSNDAHYVEAQATITQSGWNTLVFDFSQPVSRYVAAWGTAATVSLASNAVYDKISMFIDWDNGYAWNDAPVGTPPSTERTYYIDDVTFVGQVPPPTATFSTLDFSGTGYQFNAFEGTAASIVTDPSSQGSSNKILRYVESATAKSYAGVSIGLDSAFSVDPIAFDAAAGETAITARIWVDPQYGTGQVVRMQVADTAGSNDAHYVEAQATITQSGWNTLVFDFSQPVSRYVAAWGTAATVSLASNAVYDKISMFIDWDNGYAWNDAPVGTPPSTERTYYIDDVTFVGQVPPPTATFSTLDFSGTGYQFNAFEGTAASIVTDPSSQGSSNKILRYVESATAKSYAGVSIGLDSAFSVDPIAFDAAAGETAITARIWVDPQYGTGQVVRMQVADTAGSNDAHYVEAQATITQSGWNTLVFDFSQPVSRYVAAWGTAATVSLASNAVYDKISMFVDWDNGYAWNDAPVGTPPSTERTYYIDDVTFVGQVPPPTATFSTLDFSGTGYQFNAFEGTAASIVTDPSSQGSSNKILRYVESATAKSYAGVSIGLDSAFSVDPIAFDAAAGETAITARIWVDPQYGTGQVVRMQVADTAGSNDAHYVEAQATITQSGWNTLVFDFSQPVSRYVAAWGTAATVSLASNAVYDKISMFVDWDNGYAWNDAPVGTPPSTERIYYIDDVTFLANQQFIA